MLTLSDPEKPLLTVLFKFCRSMRTRGGGKSTHYVTKFCKWSMKSVGFSSVGGCAATFGLTHVRIHQRYDVDATIMGTDRLSVSLCR